MGVMGGMQGHPSQRGGCLCISISNGISIGISISIISITISRLPPTSLFHTPCVRLPTQASLGKETAINTLVNLANHSL